jgi:predicted methyltransferase
MDSVAFRTTLPMKIAFVSINEKIVDFCETYIESLDTENMEARVFGDAATARQWVEE